MKTKILLLLCALCVSVANLEAQTNLTAVPNQLDTSAPTIGNTYLAPTLDTPPTIAGAIAQLKDAVLLNNTNWLAEFHILYAPGLNNKVGGGIGYFYSVNTYVLAGLRADWVDGGFWMPSGNATFQLPIHPFAYSVFSFLPAWAQGIEITPFTYVGIGVPLSGAKVGTITIPGSVHDNNGQATAILGYGAALKVYAPTNGAWNVSIVADRETWSGFADTQYRFGGAFHCHTPESPVK